MTLVTVSTSATVVQKGEILVNDLEQRILQAFRSMNDECQGGPVVVLEEWAKAFRRRRAAALTLIVIGSSRAVPMRRKGAERGQTV